MKVQKREKKIELEIRDISKNIKNVVREYERKSKNFETKNKYLLDDFEQFIKGFRDLMNEKVKSLDEMIIKSYVSIGESLDKAGAYGIQSEGKQLIAEVKGDISNVVGFPKKTVISMLEQAGFPLEPIESK